MVHDVKDKITSLFTTTTTNNNKPSCINHVYGGGKNPRKTKVIKQLEDNIIKNTRNLFKLEKENKAIKHRIIRYIY